MAEQIRTSDYFEISELLTSVFNGSDATGLAYLRWLYSDNPVGKVLHADACDNHGVIGHYSVVPQEYNLPGRQSERWALSLNTATAERARGQGLFTRLAREAYISAQAAGIKAIIGVANANSTPGFLKKLEFSLLGPLPAIIGSQLPLPRLSVESASALTNPAQWAAALSSLDAATRTKISQVWSTEGLKWRLSSPRGPLSVHVHRAGVAIVARRVYVKYLPMLVILGTFGRSDPKQINELISTALYHTRAVAFIYAGFNDSVPIRGLPIPSQLRPAPLNLIWRDLSGKECHLRMADFCRFEFIDFDAY